MKNKKAAMEFETIVKAMIYLVLALVILGLLFTYLVGNQIPFLGKTIERYTEDCDGDKEIFFDDCPCNSDVKKFEKGQTSCSDVIKPDSAQTQCKILCKK
jgi:hypothetical protein|tara:strand:- start:15 stop:314 length:300 start_codon:yes stop_codon:yes gene_type:complete